MKRVIHTATVVIGLFMLAISYNNFTQTNDYIGSAAAVSVKNKRIITNPRHPANVKGHVEGRLLIIAKAGISDEQVDRLAKAKKALSRKKLHPQLRIHVIDLEPGVNEQDVLEEIKNDPSIESAEFDLAIAPGESFNDPYLSSQWHIPKTQSDLAWSSAQGLGVIAAVLDTGVDPAHPDLLQVAGYNFYDNNTDAKDVYGHGTSVAGSLAAIGNNSLGVSGISPLTKIMPIRVTGTDGYGYLSMMAQGLTWAADRGARVANISFGTCNSSTVQNAAEYFKSKGGLVTSSAGNQGIYEELPNSESIICVSATDSGDNRASWANYGTKIDITAPGANIYTTANGGGYRSASGTSFSSPVTAGVIALMISANQNLSPAQIESLLKQSADDLGTTGWDTQFGTGRVNSNRAVAAAISSVTQDTTKPNVSFSSPINGSTIKGVFLVKVNASDDVAVNEVEIQVDNVTVASLPSAPFEINLDTTKYVDGSHSLKAVARDSAGNSNSVTITVKVLNTIDTTAPVITSISPNDGTSVSSKSISLKATASDNIGVVKMEILVDGKLQCSSATTSVSCSWNPKKASIGEHLVESRAVDASGNVGTRSIKLLKTK